MERIYKLLILIVLVEAILVFEPFRTEPPTPEVTVNGDEIPTTQGSYCWGGFLFAQCVDFIHTSPVDMANEHSPTKVSPMEKIEINFHKTPKDGTLEIEQWVGEDNVTSIELEGDSIVVPQEKGVYVYHVMARWKQGSGNYAFSVDVE